jgi:hypothetical protein
MPRSRSRLEPRRRDAVSGRPVTDPVGLLTYTVGRLGARALHRVLDPCVAIPIEWKCATESRVRKSSLTRITYGNASIPAVPYTCVLVVYSRPRQPQRAPRGHTRTLCTMNIMVLQSCGRPPDATWPKTLSQWPGSDSASAVSQSAQTSESF